MSNSNKPSHRLVRYYGEGKNAPRAEVGVIFTGANGRATIVLNTPTEQIRLMAFPIEGDKTGGAPSPERSAEAGATGANQ